MILNTSAYPISRNTLLMEGFLAKGSKLLMSSADAVRSVAVLHSDLIPLDQQLCHIAAGIVAVSEGVRYDLAKDLVSGTDALDAVQHEQIIQMLLSEGEHLLIGIQQVRQDLPCLQGLFLTL